MEKRCLITSAKKLLGRNIESEHVGQSYSGVTYVTQNYTWQYVEDWADDGATIVVCFQDFVRNCGADAARLFVPNCRSKVTRSDRRDTVCFDAYISTDGGAASSAVFLVCLSVCVVIMFARLWASTGYDHQSYSWSS